jgi:DNA-binding beta-propeller fold protein YncE
MQRAIRNHECTVITRRALRLGAMLCAASLPFAGGQKAQSAAPPEGVRAVIKTPGFPGHVGIGYGSVWVGGHRNGTVYRVDPRTNKVVATVEVPDVLCGVFNAGFGAIWAMGCPSLAGEKSYRIDVRTNRVVRSYAGANPVPAAGSLWLSRWSQRMLVRVDPRTGHVLARIRKLGIDPRRTFIVAGARFGSLWVYSDVAVARISTATNQVTNVIALPGARPSGAGLDGGGATFADGATWFANPAGVFRVDPKSNTARLVDVRFTPFSEYWLMSIDSAGTSVWTRTGDRRIARIDTATGRVADTYPAAGGGGGIAYGFGSLWVANFASNSVWRIPVRR